MFLLKNTEFNFNLILMLTFKNLSSNLEAWNLKCENWCIFQKF